MTSTNSPLSSPPGPPGRSPIGRAIRPRKRETKTRQFARRPAGKATKRRPCDFRGAVARFTPTSHPTRFPRHRNLSAPPKSSGSSTPGPARPLRRESAQRDAFRPRAGRHEPQLGGAATCAGATQRELPRLLLGQVAHPVQVARVQQRRERGGGGVLGGGACARPPAGSPLAAGVRAMKRKLPGLEYSVFLCDFCLGKAHRTKDP
jgi:hypothetical protein